LSSGNIAFVPINIESTLIACTWRQSSSVVR